MVGPDLFMENLHVISWVSSQDDMNSGSSSIKLQTRRQEWHSVLAACDFYMARRRAAVDAYRAGSMDQLGVTSACLRRDSGFDKRLPLALAGKCVVTDLVKDQHLLL